MITRPKVHGHVIDYERLNTQTGVNPEGIPLVGERLQLEDQTLRLPRPEQAAYFVLVAVETATHRDVRGETAACERLPDLAKTNEPVHQETVQAHRAAHIRAGMFLAVGPGERAGQQAPVVKIAMVKLHFHRNVRRRHVGRVQPELGIVFVPVAQTENRHVVIRKHADAPTPFLGNGRPG